MTFIKSSLSPFCNFYRITLIRWFRGPLQNKDAWRKADERLFPDGYKYSVISPGFNGSILQKELNIQQIPRYVLYNKDSRVLLNESGLEIEKNPKILSDL